MDALFSHIGIPYVSPRSTRIGAVLVCLGLIFLASGCADPKGEDPFIWLPLQVTVTAYNDTPAQTDSLSPGIAAWGDTLRPGMAVIAVSRDLLRLGLEHNTPVLIDGLADTFWVKDKMNPRYRRYIDLYMGKDIAGAREWGRQKRVIWYRISREDSVTLARYEEAVLK